MNIHEYQAKQLFERFGVATPKGIAAATAQEAAQTARNMGLSQYVVKAQVHAGGRGKGTFKNGFKGGVHVVKSVEEVEEVAGKMLNQVLVTKQTGETGKLVSKIMVAEAVDLKKECYFAILQDRARECPVIVASTEGGMDIEEVAATRPEAIIREHIDPALGILPFQALKIAVALGLTGPLLRQATKLITNVYKLFTALDCSLVEINPLVVTTDDRVCALDAKFNFDDNALYRHPEIMEMRDETEEDPREVEAGKYDLNYIGLDGNIGCMVNGEHKIVSVIKVMDYSEADVPAVEREMMFVKVQAEGPARDEILRAVEIFRCRVVDVSHNEMTIEATGDHEKIEAILGLLHRFGIKEIARTGSVAMRRSRKEY